MRKHIFSSLALVAAMFAVSSLSFTLYADSADEAIKLSKTINRNADGTYTLDLEAYVTGSSVTTSSETVQATDIVLVLDVSGSMDNDMPGEERTVYTALRSQSYSYSSIEGFSVLEIGGNDNLFYLAPDGNYYRVRGYLDQKGTNRHFLPLTIIPYWVRYGVVYLFYEDASGVRHYLSGSGVTDTAPTASDVEETQTLWTGVLYTQSSTSVTKMEKLKDSVEAFIDVVAENATANNVDHRISIVKFATAEYYGSENSTAEGNHTGADRSTGYNYTEIVKNLTSVKSSAGALKDAVNSLKPGGATAADYGMRKALVELNEKSDTDHPNKVVVMFTDGDPTHSSGFSNSVANSTISTSKGIKAVGTRVYSVGVFSNPSANVLNYMSYVSSNYPQAASMTNPGTKASEAYSFNAGNSTELTSIFQTIAINSTEGGSPISLNAETTSVVDVVAKDFKLPENAISNGKISAETILCTGFSNGDYIWSSSATPMPSSYISIVEGNTVEVSGFSFTKPDDIQNNIPVENSGNWVGVRTINGTDRYWGRKLHIRIEITENPASLGGYGIYSNGLGSGIRADVEGQPTMLKTFDRPTVDIPSMVIAKKGLSAGESATFRVQRVKDGSGVAVNDAPFNIILTGKSGEEWSSRIIQSIPEGTYSVTESGWSWTYTVDATDNTIVKDLVEGNAVNAEEYGFPSDRKFVIYPFVNTAKTNDLPKHSEAYNLNDFRTSKNEVVKP